MFFLIGLITTAALGYFFYSALSGGGNDSPRLVETPSAGQLSLEEQAAFRATFAEVIECWVTINDGLADIDKDLKQDLLPEVQRHFEMIREPIDAFPEVASQGEEFRGSSQEPVWWSQHMMGLAERLTELDEGDRITEALSIEQVQGPVKVAHTVLEDMMLSCDDFARRMLGINVLTHIKGAHGPDSAKRARAALSAAQRRETF